MSSSTEFYKHGDWRSWGAPRKEPWYDYEIAQVLRDKYAPSARSEYWIHVHGPTPDQALAAAQAHLKKHDLQGVFKIGKSSMVSTDRFDRNSFGCFYQLEPVDPARAHEFCSELHSGTERGLWSNEPIDESDPYDPKVDRAFLEYLNRPARGPRPF